MDAIMILIPTAIFLSILYGIIKAAVANGIDSAQEIKLLRSEIRDLKKQIKENEHQSKNNHIFDKKA